MTTKARVAVLYTQPETILQDYQRLFELAGGAHALQPNTTTILKDNISWHFPMPAANTTPWQLEGTIRALRQAGFNDLSCVQNHTVVTNAFKGEDLNGYIPIFRHYDIPVLYNFRKEDMTWIPYRPKASMLGLDHIYPKGIYLPDYFFGEEYRSPADRQDAHVHHNHGRDKKCFWGIAQQIPALYAHLDS